MTDKHEKKSEEPEKEEAQESPLKGKSLPSIEDEKAKRWRDTNDSRPKW